MLVEEAHPAEGLLAAGAGVLLVLEVGLEVGPQVGLVRKPPGAVGAGERFLARVCSHVSLQEPGPREGFPALCTLAGQGVGLDVHLQRGLGVVVLLTKLAGKFLLNLVGSVQLLVASKPRLCRKALFTFMTKVGTYVIRNSGFRLEYCILVKFTGRMRDELVLVFDKGLAGALGEGKKVLRLPEGGVLVPKRGVLVPKGGVLVPKRGERFPEGGGAHWKGGRPQGRHVRRWRRGVKILDLVHAV